MSNYYKKLLPLKESKWFYDKHAKKIKGALNVYVKNGECSTSVTFITCDFSLLKDYQIIISDGVNVFSVPLEEKFNFAICPSNIEVDDNVRFLIEKDGFIAVCYPENLSSNEVDCILNKVKSADKSPTTKYDDYAISEVNYYENEHDFYDEDVNFKKGHHVKKEKIDGNEKFNYNETDSCKIKEFDVFKPDTTKLKRLLKLYPKEKSLMAILPSSDFVCINYDDVKKYVVGTTTINDVEYFCLGVEATSKNKQLKNSVFVPSSFINDSEGYYLIFQPLNNKEKFFNGE